MGWRDVISEGVVASRSTTESGVLAPEVWHMWVGEGAPEDPARVTAALDQTMRADVVIARYASGQVWVASLLASCGRTVVPAGNIIYWQRTHPIAAAGAAEHDAHIRLLRTDDADRCRALIAATFAGYTNHYVANPWLAPISTADAYADWAVRSLGQVDLEVVEWVDAGGEPSGIGLTRRTDDHVEILLAGMVPASRGRGGYSAFLAAIVNRALAGGAARVVISTQDHNVAVQRLWCRAGFEPVLGVTVVHLVDRSLAGGTSRNMDASGS